MSVDDASDLCPSSPRFEEGSLVYAAAIKIYEGRVNYILDNFYHVSSKDNEGSNYFTEEQLSGSLEELIDKLEQKLKKLKEMV